MTTTDDYLRYRASYFGKSAIVLDLGCGDGRFVEMLLDGGLNIIGVDIPDARPSIEARAAKRPDLDLTLRISYFEDPERIPLPDSSVDVVISNTVFEHILTLNSTVSELARILKPGGRVYTVFPLGSAIIEQHCGLPLIHSMESRALRLLYLKAAKAVGLYRNNASPEAMESYIYNHVFYRRANEISALFASHFEHVETDAIAYVEIKGDALMRDRNWLRRGVGKLLKTSSTAIANFVHIRHSAAFCLYGPRKSDVPKTL